MNTTSKLSFRVPESLGEPLDALVEEGHEYHDGEGALLEEVDGAEPDDEHDEADDEDARQEGGAPHHRAVGLQSNSMVK